MGGGGAAHPPHVKKWRAQVPPAPGSLPLKSSLLVPLHKDGDNEEVGNYREIAVCCSMAKVFMRVVARRLRLGRFVEDRILTEAQGVFRSHRRCSHQWLVLRGV